MTEGGVGAGEAALDDDAADAIVFAAELDADDVAVDVVDDDDDGRPLVRALVAAHSK